MPTKVIADSILRFCLLLPGALACADSAGPNSTNLPPCTSDVAITVSSGPAPRFSWSPACKTFFLLVESVGTGADAWSIMTPGADELAPGIRYGTVPAGAEELDPPASLSSGSSYAVHVFRHTGPDSDDGILIGSQTFTP